MKPKTFFKLTTVIALVLALGSFALVAHTTAQESAPQEPVSSAASTGTDFTYQGSLTEGGSPANGDYDFEFKLYDTVDGTNQVGSIVTVNDQSVTDGLFTVNLNFGDVFYGKALWLDISVRAGAETGNYTALTPRQSLTAAPYALSLRPGARIEGDLPLLSALSTKNTNSVAGYGLAGTTDADTAGAGVFGVASSSSGEVYGVWGISHSTSGYGVYGEAPLFGVYGEATQNSNYAYGVYGKSRAALGAGVRGKNSATTGNAFGVYGSTDSDSGYAGYFSNEAGGADIMAAGSGIIKSNADSVLYLSPHDMVVRGSSAVSVTPLSNGGVDIYYWSSGWKYLSIPVSTFGTLFGSPLYIKSIEVCYDTESDGFIETTAVEKNNGSTGPTHYIVDDTDRKSSTYECYTVIDSTPAVIDNSTWVQFNIWAGASGHTNIYTVKLTVTETP